MFVVVTVVAVPAAWIGYNLNWIRERHEFWGDDDPLWRAPDAKSTAPGLLWLFGEKGIPSMSSYGYETIDDARKAKAYFDRLFPESNPTEVYYGKDEDPILLE
jgi:hypothetical protein